MNAYGPSEVKRDSLGDFSFLNEDVITEVFSRLDVYTLNKVCLVSKAWKRRAEGIPMKRLIYHHYAFGSPQWARYFGPEVVQNENLEQEFLELPSDIGPILRKVCLVFPMKRVGQTHVLVRIPKGLTINKLGLLAQKYFPSNPSGYKSIWQDVATKMGEEEWKKSCWVLMTRQVVPGSGGKSGIEQRQMIQEFSQIHYDLPLPIPAIAVIFAKYVSSGDFKIRLFSDLPKTMIYTKGALVNYRYHPVVVGDFGVEGLKVDIQFFRSPTTFTTLIRYLD